MREMLFSVSRETLQTDLGGLEAPSGYGVLITIAILWVSRIFPHSGVKSHNICTPAVLVNVPLVSLLVEAPCLVSSSHCADELICLEVGEGLLERKECLIG